MNAYFTTYYYAQEFLIDEEIIFKELDLWTHKADVN